VDRLEYTLTIHMTGPSRERLEISSVMNRHTSKTWEAELGGWAADQEQVIPTTSLDLEAYTLQQAKERVETWILRVVARHWHCEIEQVTPSAPQWGQSRL